MGWRDKIGGTLKKAGGVAVKVGKSTPMGAAVSGAAEGLAGALVGEHGDEIADLLDKVDRIAEGVDSGLVTKEQADKIEADILGIRRDMTAMAEKSDRIANRVNSIEVNCMTQCQASRLEAKIDKALRLLEAVHADHFGTQEDK